MKRVFTPLILIFTAILALLSLYIAWRITATTEQQALVALGALLLFLLPTVHWRHQASEATSSSFKLLQQASYVSMAFMSWLLVLTVTRDLMLLLGHLLVDANRLAHFEAASRGYPLFAGAIIITGLGVLNTFRGLRVRELSIPIEGLPTELEGLKIAQISDLHIGPTIGRGYVEKLARLVRELDPDLTVLTGDIVDGSLKHLRSSAAPLAHLLPKGRVFFVPGNHEYYWAIDEWLAELQGLGASILLNEGKRFLHNGRKVWVGGVTDPAAAQTRHGARPDVAKAAVGGEEADFRLLLSHRPGFASQAAAAGFHLQLSGHTHGGQFFPWTHVAKLFHQHFIGLMKHQSMWIYVSPGTGTWGPPQRLGTTPELSLLRLTCAPHSS